MLLAIDRINSIYRIEDLVSKLSIEINDKKMR